MIDHVSLRGARSRRPRRASMSALLATARHDQTCAMAGATVGFGKKYPEFWINLRADMAPIAADSGMHICLRAASTEAVDAFHAAALAAGGASDGAPGLAPEYGEGYYAAFIRDPDGNRIEAVTFVATTVTGYSCRSAISRSFPSRLPAPAAAAFCNIGRMSSTLSATRRSKFRSPRMNSSVFM